MQTTFKESKASEGSICDEVMNMHVQLLTALSILVRLFLLEFSSTDERNAYVFRIIAICSAACVGAGSYIAYKFYSSPDVRYFTNKRGSEIRWWGDDKANLRLNK